MGFLRRWFRILWTDQLVRPAEPDGICRWCGWAAPDGALFCSERCEREDEGYCVGQRPMQSRLGHALFG